MERHTASLAARRLSDSLTETGYKAKDQRPFPLGHDPRRNDISKSLLLYVLSVRSELESTPGQTQPTFLGIS